MKWIFLWTPPRGTSIAAFASDARDVLAETLREVPVSSIHVTEREPPRVSLVPFARQPLAMISVRGEDDVRDRTRESLRSLPGSIAGYVVNESTPRARSVTVRGRAPGICMLTLFRKRESLPRTDFFREWFEHHTPLALEIHPTVGYSRNVVEASVVPGSPPWDGIVTEDFADETDVLSTARLFGGASRAIANMVRVGLHVPTFLDLATLENHLMTEYR